MGKRGEKGEEGKGKGEGGMDGSEREGGGRERGA